MSNSRAKGLNNFVFYVFTLAKSCQGTRFLKSPFFLLKWIFIELRYVQEINHQTTRFHKFITIKPTRYTNFSNLFLKWNSKCFGQFLCPSPGVFHCTHCNGICHTVLLTACEQDQDGNASITHTTTIIYKTSRLHVSWINILGYNLCLLSSRRMCACSPHISTG